MGAGTRGKGWGTTPNKSTYTMGSDSGEKESIGGKVIRGKDLRSGAGKNDGAMPRKMNG